MMGAAAHPVRRGARGRRRAPQMAATSLQGTRPSPATLNVPGSWLVATNSRARTTSSSSTNCRRGSKPRMQGAMPRSSEVLMGVTMSVPSTLAKRRSVTTTWGLSSAKSRR